MNGLVRDKNTSMDLLVNRWVRSRMDGKMDDGQEDGQTDWKNQ